MNLQTIIFKEGSDGPDGIPEHAACGETARSGTRAGRHILCGQCRNMIADPAAGIWMNGGHRHTFANPGGFVYEIGCFGAAPGCRVVGPASDEFTWFSGYLWRVAICSKCLTHLGWQFFEAGGTGFYGLILDRLIEPEQRA